MPPFDELYDPETLEVIEAWARRRVSSPACAVPGDAPTAEAVEPAGRRDPRSMGLGGGMLAAALFGLADAIDPRQEREEVVEEVPGRTPSEDQPVTFLYAPDPKLSRLVIRPWRFER